MWFGTKYRLRRYVRKGIAINRLPNNTDMYIQNLK